MLILHGTWFRDRFLLWAESAEALLAYNRQGHLAGVPVRPSLKPEEDLDTLIRPDQASGGLKHDQDELLARCDQEEFFTRHNPEELFIGGNREEFFTGGNREEFFTGGNREEFVSRSEQESLIFGASEIELREALFAASMLSETLAVEQTAVWVPEVDGVALASSAMIGRSLDDADQTNLSASPYMVWSCPLGMAALIDLLCLSVEGKPIAPGTVPGQDLQFWALAMRFAATLVARQQFLPGIKVTSQGCFAAWEPVFLGPDGEMLARLARNMPGVCLACEGDPKDIESNRSSELMAGFLGQITDFLVRDQTHSGSLPSIEPLLKSQDEDRQSKDENQQSNIHQRWLEALLDPSAILHASEQEIAKLSGQIAEWRRPVEVASDCPFRLCFRLEEPLIELEPDHKPELDAELRFGLESGLDSSLKPGLESELDSSLKPGLESGLKSALEPGCETASQSGRSPGAWYVRFLLQSVRDPGLLFPVETVLSKSFEDLPLLRGGRVSAREYLFRALGQAVRLCPEIESSFSDVHPKGYTLDTAGAYKFLEGLAPLLKNAGFSVLLPSWWTAKKKISAKAKVFSSNTPGGSLFGLKTIAQYDWQLALGGQPISIEDLEKLAQLNIPLLQWQGMWIELNPEALKPILSFFRQNAGRQKLSGQELLKLALAQPALPDGILFDGIEGEGQVVDLVQKLQTQSDFEELPANKRFKGELRPYQMRGMSWLAFLKQLGLGACLADDMGLGKTVQTLAFIQRSWYEGKAKDRKPTLLVCPTSVIGNWQREAAKFTPELNVMVHHGLDRPDGRQFRQTAAASSIVVTSYALLHRDLEDIKKLSWETVVLDEAQNIKNPETRQAIAASSLRADFRLALTGTPVENSVGDLWSIMNFLNPGFLGKNSDFKSRFLKPIQVYQQQDKMQLLRRLTGPFILRRLKTDKSIVTDLPEKFERKTRCHLTKEQASLYAAVVEEATGALDETSGIKRKSLVLTTLLRLKQICDHPVLVQKDRTAKGVRSGKLKRLTEMLEAVSANNEKALIFTQFAEMGKIIQNHLQSVTGKEVLFLYGATGRQERDSMVERFQKPGKGPSIFVLSLKAGGTGLNLTRANHVFHFDRWWNPAVENQATDRAYRIGQESDVSVHKFICAGTLEESIDEIIERKKILASNTIGSGEGWLTELSTSELRDIFTLKESVLVE